MMTMYFLSRTNPKGAEYSTAVHNVDGRKYVNDGYCMKMLVGRHSRRSVNILRAQEGAVRAVKSLRIRYTFRVECKPISRYQAARLSKTATIFTAIVRRKARVTKTMKSLQGYLRAFEENYGARFVNGHITDTME